MTWNSKGRLRSTRAAWLCVSRKGNAVGWRGAGQTTASKLTTSQGVRRYKRGKKPKPLGCKGLILLLTTRLKTPQHDQFLRNVFPTTAPRTQANTATVPAPEEQCPRLFLTLQHMSVRTVGFLASYLPSFEGQFFSFVFFLEEVPRIFVSTSTIGSFSSGDSFFFVSLFQLFACASKTAFL